MGAAKRGRKIRMNNKKGYDGFARMFFKKVSKCYGVPYDLLVLSYNSPGGSITEWAEELNEVVTITKHAAVGCTEETIPIVKLKGCALPPTGGVSPLPLMKHSDETDEQLKKRVLKEFCPPTESIICQ